MTIPNTWHTRARVSDPARRERWIQIGFEDGIMPIKSIITTWAVLPGHPDGAAIYEMDLSLITPEQREALIRSIAHSFNLDEAKVERDLDKHGVPILADQVVALTTRLGLFL